MFSCQRLEILFCHWFRWLWFIKSLLKWVSNAEINRLQQHLDDRDLTIIWSFEKYKFGRRYTDCTVQFDSILCPFKSFMRELKGHNHKRDLVCVSVCVVWILWGRCDCHVNEPHYWETTHRLNERSAEDSRGEAGIFGFVDALLFSRGKAACDLL